MEEVSDPNGEDKHPEEVMLTFRDLRMELKTIGDLPDHEVEDACDGMLAKIAAAKLGKSDNSRLAGMLRDLYPDPKPTKKAVEDDIKEIGKRMTGHLATETGAIVDAEKRVIDYALEDSFDARGGDGFRQPNWFTHY